MGLAASQSRFLALTSRKAACEFQSMQFAQQKLSISREMTKASEEYENSLNATKLVWNASGTSDSATTEASDTATTTALSYDVMMKPSKLNGYDPYLITNPQGQIVLDSKYAAAATAAGLKPTGGARSSSGFTDFLNALKDQGIVSESMATAILTTNDAKQYDATTGELTTTTSYYQKNAGVGATPLDKTSTNAMTLATLGEYLQGSSYKINMANINNISYDANSFWAKLIVANSSSLILTSDNYSASTSTKDKDTYSVKSGSTALALSDLSLVSIGDIMSGNYRIERGGSTSKGDIAKYVQAFLTKVSTLLGYDPSGSNTSYKGLYTDSDSLTALQSAYATTLLEFGSANATEDSIYNASDYNTIMYDKSGSTSASVNLTNVINAFLTNYAQALTGYAGGYAVNDKVSTSNLVTDDLQYYYITGNDTSIANDDTLLNADFYSMMYNQICANGWTSDTKYNVDNSEYLENEIKNGQLFVSALSTDGYYYQNNYSDTGYVEEVTDSDAIALAEAEYTAKKSKLNNKEEAIDLQAKKLDLEISAITTEYDTVKNLISKNIEKTFSMFSS
ncbi:MAG: hypothetical protein LKG27_05620 [Clostridiaceae bacterium]|jgi:hypothetical protein|nr:hypothetical protein [Clostridiaceae bacterium]